jgi:chromosome segregation ATPase
MTRAGEPSVLQSEPLMSSKTPMLHDQAPHDDLDRTDELPVLDVEAYEAGLYSQTQGLARTDTWSVEALQDLDELTQARDALRSASDLHPNVSSADALTANVDSILQRIAALEADVVAAHAANEVLQRRNDELSEAQEQANRQRQSLEAENARITEARELAKEMAERAEHKLRSQLDEATRELAQVNEAHVDALAQAAAQYADLQSRLELSEASAVQARQRNQALQQEVERSTSLLGQQVQAIAGLEEALAEQKTLKAQLSRQFAAKLTDYDKLTSILDLRDQAVEALSSERDRLTQEVSMRDAAIEQAQAERAKAIEQSQVDRARLAKSADALAALEDETNALRQQLGASHRSIADLESRSQQADERIRELIATHETEQARRLEVDGYLAGQVEQLEQSRAESKALSAELLDLRATESRLLSDLERERVAADAARGEAVSLSTALSEREAELKQLQDDIAEVRRSSQVRIGQLTRDRDGLQSVAAELQTTRRALEESADDIVRLREALEATQAKASADLQSLAEERDALRPAAEELAARSIELQEALEANEHLRTEVLASHAAAQETKRAAEAKEKDLHAVEARVRELTLTIRGLEVAISARDELAEQLRADLQTAREERAIVAGQLEKVRKRVKSLTEEVFKRDHEIAELRTDLGVHSEALAAIRRDVNRIGKDASAQPASDHEHFLEPVDHEGPVIALTSKMLTIGRTNETDVCLPSKLVSRHHARVLVGPTGVIIEDAGSTNGCFVNGKQIRKHLLHEGDVLELGDLRYRLRTRSASDTRARATVLPFDKPTA